MMPEEVQRAIDVSIALSATLCDAGLVAEIALDCVENQVDSLEPKLRVLLTHLTSLIEMVNSDLPYRLQVLDSALRDQVANLQQDLRES